MKSRLLALWRSLPTPLRRSAHLLAGVPKIVAVATEEAWRTKQEEYRRKKALSNKRRRRSPFFSRNPNSVTVVGFHQAVHGLGEGARLLVKGMADAGLRTHAIDLSAFVGLPCDLEMSAPPPSDKDRSVLISHINPPELIRWTDETEGRFLKGRRHIGYWAWELEQAPEEWIPAFDLVDEVWAPSAFAADAIRKIAPSRVKVSAAPYPLYLTSKVTGDRARFGLPADRVIVFMAFDLRSTAQRKNPRAALKAFQIANRTCNGAALLVCKVVGADLFPEVYKGLADEVATDPSIRLMTESLQALEMTTLTASVDIVLSLHRSEGYGLLLAEAIWQGKPVLATGWSSNAEFMDPASSAFVQYELVAVDGDGAIYRQGRWAEADVADAAAKLAGLISDATLRERWSAATKQNPHVSFRRDAWLAMTRGLLRIKR